MSDIGPCYGCPDRHLHCHSGCKRHKDYYAIKRAEKAKIREIKSKNYIYTDYVKERYVKHRIADTVQRKRKQSLK